MKLLFHGSNVIVKKPLLLLGKPHRDFGKAFYLTDDEHQAIKWARIRTRNDNFTGRPTLNKFIMRENTDLKILKFDMPNEKWLKYLVKNRFSSQNFNDDFDIVTGPIADGYFLIKTLDDYRHHQLSYQETIDRLHTENLSQQWAFKTEKAISCLDFRGATYEKY